MVDTNGWDSVKWDQDKEIKLDDEGVYKITYYLKKWTDPSDSSNIIYELHGNCWAWGV